MCSEETTIHYSENGDTEQDEIILAPIGYLNRIPGRKLESDLTCTFNYWLKVPIERLNAINDLIEIVRDSNLLLDDIEDNSQLRRGVPAAHIIYGTPRTINAANYTYMIAYERLLSFKNLKAIRVLIEQFLKLHRGQGMELYWRDNFVCPTEAEYRLMCTQKTGALFELGVRLMQLFSDSKQDFTPLLSILGYYFQIRDDYCTLCKQEYVDYKGYCEDITEGKFSFPIVHAVQSHARDSDSILHILRQKTENIELKKHCVNLLEKSGSFTYTKQVLSDLDRQARQEIERLGGNPHLTTFLDKLLSWKKTPNYKKDDLPEGCLK